MRNSLQAELHDVPIAVCRAACQASTRPDFTTREMRDQPRVPHRVPALVPAIRKKQGLSGRIHDNERDGRQQLQETRHTASIVHGQEAELRRPMRLASSSPWRRRMGRSSKDTWSAGRYTANGGVREGSWVEARDRAGAANVEAWWFRYHRAAKARYANRVVLVGFLCYLAGLLSAACLIAFRH